MTRLLFVTAAIAASSVFFGTGCFEHAVDKMFVGSEGENQAAHFKFTTSSCIVGCGLAHTSALKDSKATIQVQSGDPSRRLTARLAGTSSTRIASQAERCECIRGDESPATEPSRECGPGELKRCFVDLEITTSAEGDDKIELVDGSGQLYDRASLRIRSAARLDLRKRREGEDQSSALEGTLDVAAGEKVNVSANPVDADNTSIAYDISLVMFEYADRAIVGPEPDFIQIDSSDSMMAHRAGETQVSVRLQGTEAIARFRVR